MQHNLVPPPAPFAHLNDPQRLAVETVDGPVLVLAGAGTGKTRVLTTRLAHILQSHRAYPSQILAVTFTNKAAQEMRERVAHLIGQPVEGWWLGTFHALAARMLRAHAQLVGLTSNYTIIDEDDQVRLMKQIAEGANIDPKKWPPKVMIDIISRWKDKALNPSDITQGEAGDFAGGKLPQLYRAYQDRLRTVNACDFGDLLLHVINIFKNPAHRDVLADYHRRFKYILVDEYQDTNVAQYLWLRLLAAGSNNICCVGDDDQSIYGWRGAEIANILKFERDFPGAVLIRLEENYRSTGHILAAAGALIAHNQGRLGKTLWTSDVMGDKVQIIGVWDGETEARTISDQIESLKISGQKLSSIAILVRASFQMREFEDRFLQIGLPYRVFGGPRFYERAEIRDAMAYFRVVSQPHDDLALARIINTPKRGLGDTTLNTLHSHARARGTSLYTAIEDLILTTTLKPKVQQTLAHLIRDFDRWRTQLATTPHAELAGIILDESGYTAMWQGDKSPDAPGRLENLKELVTTMADYETLPAFLEHVALVLDNAQNQDTDQLSIMTLHAAKGLEFDTVFLPGWEDGLFPSQRTMDENGNAGLEEERRLAYVGLTRARKRAVITLAGSRRQYGNWVQNPPSRFIDELPTDHIVTNAATGMMHAQPHDTRKWAHTDSISRPVIEATDNNPYHVGARVTHDDFGPGQIIHVRGNKLDIAFDDGQIRRIIDHFVTIVS